MSDKNPAEMPEKITAVEIDDEMIDRIPEDEVQKIEALSVRGHDDSGESDLWEESSGSETQTDAGAAENDAGSRETPKESMWSKPDSDEDRQFRADSYRQLGTMGSFGVFLLLALGFGYVIGGACDSLFGTKPVFTVFWLVCAVAASVIELVKQIKAAKKLGEEHTKDP